MSSAEAVEDSYGAALAAANEIIDAFGGHERDRYFALFDEDATFIFHSSDRLLPNRLAYEQEWKSWEATGFRVLSCRSSDQRIDLVSDDIAVFTHRVSTHLRDADGEHGLDERETIVLRRDREGRWLGIHEHLSQYPSLP